MARACEDVLQHGDRRPRHGWRQGGLPIAGIRRRDGSQSYLHHPRDVLPRTHDTTELLDGCPDRSIDQLRSDYSTEFIEEFSAGYLAPYILDQPVQADEFENSREFTEQIIAWATAAVTRRDRVTS